MSDTPLLSARDLQVRFGGVLAVNKVSFDVGRGEVFTIIGPNGAGKTTVFNLISRIYTPTAGTIDFEGHRLSEVLEAEAGADVVAEARDVVRQRDELRSAVEGLLRYVLRDGGATIVQRGWVGACLDAQAQIAKERERAGR